MRPTRRQVLATAGAASLAALAGCGDDDAEDSKPSVDGQDSPTNDGGDGSVGFLQPLQQQAILSPEEDERGSFGHAVAVSGDGSTAVVGAAGDVTVDADAGSVYVFSRVGEDWHQQDRLLASDGDGDDELGDAVSISTDGATVVAGATGDDRNGTQAGTAHVFTQTENGWEHQAKLVPDDGDENDRFGASTALSDDGTTAVVGASWDDDPNGTQAGSAYVFTRGEGGWQQRAKLAPAEGDTEENFGRSVGLSGDGTTAVVGCPGDGGRDGQLRGSAYVFTRADGGWQQRTTLLAEDGNADDSLGHSVAVSGDGATAVVGARREEEPHGQNAGAAYVFARAESGWHQQTKLTARDGNAGEFFGDAVTLAAGGETAVVGARFARGATATPGVAYVFARAGGGWQQQDRLTPEGGHSYQFGATVAISDDGTAVVGAPGENVPESESPSSVYVFA